MCQPTKVKKKNCKRTSPARSSLEIRVMTEFDKYRVEHMKQKKKKKRRPHAKCQTFIFVFIFRKNIINRVQKTNFLFTKILHTSLPNSIRLQGAAKKSNVYKTHYFNPCRLANKYGYSCTVRLYSD